jgi:hypothetical protein
MGFGLSGTQDVELADQRDLLGLSPKSEMTISIVLYLTPLGGRGGTSL